MKGPRVEYLEGSALLLLGLGLAVGVAISPLWTAQADVEFGRFGASTTAPGLVLPSARTEVWTDYLEGCLGSGCQAFPFFSNVSGTGASCQTNNVVIGSDFGHMECDTGTTATGRGEMIGGTNQVYLGSGAAYFEGRVWMEDLSDATDTYTFTAGLSDDTTGGSGTDAVGFRYTNGENAGEWVCYTRSNSTETTADSNVVVTADTWFKLAFTVNAAASSVGFTINGTSVCTITTNIPTGTARAVGFVPASITKTVGTNVRLFETDYSYYRFDFTTPR